jgi:parallel beta-helix repeat protein
MPDLEAGICLNGTTGCTISDNHLVDNGFSGISLLYSQYNKIICNRVNHTEWSGIHLLGSSQNVVSGNVVDNTTHEYGVGINGHASSNYNNITENIISNSRYGSFYHASSHNNICGNNISNIAVEGIWLQDQVNYNLVAENTLINNTVAIRLEGPNYNNTLSRNLITGALYGVKIENSARYTRIVDNIIMDNRAGNDSWSAGIRLDSAPDSQIHSNNITGNNYGVLLYSSSPRVSILNNTIASNEFGVRVASGGSNYVNISDNVVMNNLGYGIGLTGFGSASNYATVSRNLIVNNSDGIALGQSSSYHQIFRNNISENGYGFYIEYSAQNTIWGNNIIGNGQQVYISGSSVNNWNSSYPTGGNYWSDYSGVDLYGGPGQNEAGSDEIGDVPYVISADNTDRYPLMRPWIPFENQAIIIRGDGGIDPSGAPIGRRGDIYTLTGNIASDADGLVIERDSVILDGAGFELLGGQSGGVGINLTGRNNVTIKNLKIADFGCGALLDSSSGNTLCHSSFVNNTLQINNLTPGYANSWDNGCEGNYWSDYAARYPEASQVNSTGIWDTPYEIDANDIDRFPLMNVYWNPCDINHDLKVDMKDIGSAAKAFGTVPGDSFWNPHTDITGPQKVPDGKVDMRDIGLIARNFGVETV